MTAKRRQSKPTLQIQPGKLRRLSSDGSASRFIRTLHRGKRAYITFHSITFHTEGKKFKNLFSVLAKHVKEFSGQILGIRGNAYFSINGFRRCELKDEHPPHFFEGVRSRKGRHVKYLNAIYSDIDCYNKSLDPDEALKRIGKLIETKQLPTPSCGLIGHGLWLFWLLCDEKKPDLPPRARSKNISTYRKVMEQVRDVLGPFGPDSGAIDTARTTRVPGSMNSKNDKKVQVLWPEGGQQLPYYTLTELSEFFKLETSPPEPAPKQATPPTPPTRKSDKPNNWIRVNRQHVKQFLKLEEIRRGFRKGCRNRAALAYARYLMALRTVAPNEVLDVAQEVARFGKGCRPRLSRSEIRDALQSARKKLQGPSGGRVITNERISELLVISLDEHAALKKTFGRHAWKPCAAEFKLRRVDVRREAIRTILADEPLVPSPGKMVKMLQKHGLVASRSQVVKDYQRLDIRTERQKRTEPSA